jgi:hypothetical protein
MGIAEHDCPAIDLQQQPSGGLSDERRRYGLLSCFPVSGRLNAQIPHPVDHCPVADPEPLR